MQLYYHISSKGNFGDDLNRELWDRVLPNCFDDSKNEIFVGIGTILNDLIPPAKKTVIFGAGVGYGHGLPKIDSTWEIYFVRGPLSAQKLGLDAKLALTDPAILVAAYFNNELNIELPKYGYSVMPHACHAGKAWADLCESLGFGYIDPRQNPQQVLSLIRKTEVLITESLHGAIIADAFRIPWIPIQTSADMLPFKWQDWCSSMNVPLKMNLISPFYFMPLWDVPKVEKTLSQKVVFRLKLELIKAQIKHISQVVKPQLSLKSMLSTRLGQIQNQIEKFKLKYQKK